MPITLWKLEHMYTAKIILTFFFTMPEIEAEIHILRGAVQKIST